MSGRGHRGGAMFADKSRTRSSWQLFKILLGYLEGYGLVIAVVSVVILAYTVMATYQPIIIQQALDLLVDDPTSSRLQVLTIIFILVSVFVWIFQSLNTWLVADISTGIVDKIRRMAFSKLVHADMSYHHKNQSGNVTSRVVTDSGEIAAGLTVFTQASTELLLVFATFIILVDIGWQFALISLIAVPVAFILSKVIGSIGRRRMLRTRQAYGAVSGKLAENLAGVAIAKSFNQEERVSKEIKELNDESYGYMKSLLAVFILVFPSISMVSTLLVFGVLWTGGFLYDTGDITIGNIFLATVMVQRFLRPIINLSQQYTQLQASLAALDRLTDIFEAHPAIQNSPNAEPLDINGGFVEFHDVTFAYERDPVLENVTFEIPAGSKVALVGHTGAGKTTLTALLMRFYDPNSGVISIDGQDIKNVTLETLNQAISLVSQEPYLFADTVIENIRYGKSDATDEDIYDICQLIGADEFIEALPQGYETRLEESGKNLSAGQRQMITIARTMLSDPNILVLDEATSRLDAYSESLVQSAQRMLFEGRTTLIIAHRLSTIRDVDYIVVLENGRVLEQGKHEQLMENQGKYSELYSMYYAHQGTGEITVMPMSNGTSETKHAAGKIHVESSLLSRRDWYQEQIRINVNQAEEDLYIDGDYELFDLMLDGFIQRLLKMSKMHQEKLELDFRVELENNLIHVDVIHKSIVIPEKFRSMMKDPNAKSPHSPPGPSLTELVSQTKGEFEIISPLPGYDKGVAFRASYKMN